MSITIQKSTTKNGVCCALRKTATLKENFGRIIGLKVRNGTMKTKWIIMQELEDRRKALEEREATFQAQLKKYDDRDAELAKIASYWYNMPPKTAVAEIDKMEDQDVIDVFRKEDELATLGRRASMVSVWFMNMDPERAARLQRKMTNKPQKLD
jgi:flagellar motility protein MotE (MotC chaperone)